MLLAKFEFIQLLCAEIFSDLLYFWLLENLFLGFRFFLSTLYILAPIYPTPIEAVRKFEDKINKNAKALKIHSVILLDLFPQLHILFNSLHVANNNYFNGNFWFNALDMHTFMLSGSRSVRNGIPFSDSRHFRS